jgi:prepilin-type N-terminal cleavage/methylation domain-containing protein
LKRLGSEELRAERKEGKGKSREGEIKKFMLHAPSPKICAQGFTLIEVSIVIFIMLLMTSATVPWMRTFAESTRLRSTARSIRSLIEFARTSAITQRTEYVVLFDPDQGEYWLSLMEFLDAESGEVVSDASRTSLADSLAALEEENAANLLDEDDEEETEGNFSRTGGILGIPKQLPGGISIVKISSPRSSGREGEVEYITFRPNGTSEDFEVYLQSGSGRVFLLTVAETTGRTRTRELTVEEIDELGLVISE